MSYKQKPMTNVLGIQKFSDLHYAELASVVVVATAAAAEV
jgi:hypothetical protein